MGRKVTAMKRNLFLLLILLLLLSGCSFFQELLKTTDPNEVAATGDAMQKFAPAAGAFNPIFGVILYAVGGAVALAGSVIKKLKE